MRKRNRFCQFFIFFFNVCSKASPYSLHLQHSVVSVKTDDEAWVSKFLDRHKRLLGPQSARQAARIPLFSPDHPWAAPGLSGLSWVPRLLRQAAARSPSLYVVFHNQPKIPQHPRLGVAEKLNIAEIQLCEKAAGCGCSTPNQHMGLTTLHVLWSWNGPFSTSPICGIHRCRQDWLFLSDFAFSPVAPLRWVGIVITLSPFLPISGPSFVHPKIGPLWHMHVYTALTFPNWHRAML